MVALLKHATPEIAPCFAFGSVCRIALRRNFEARMGRRNPQAGFIEVAAVRLCNQNLSNNRNLTMKSIGSAYGSRTDFTIS